MTPSTTNTAARENLARDTRTIVSDLQSARDRLMPVLTEQYGDAFDGDFDSMLEAINALKRFATATLTQQQGGEQEAGDCGDEALQRAYWLGWRNSAAWADRKDLWADRDSPAYTQERDDALGTLAAAVKLGKE